MGVSLWTLISPKLPKYTSDIYLSDKKNHWTWANAESLGEKVYGGCAVAHPHYEVVAPSLYRGIILVYYVGYGIDIFFVAITNTIDYTGIIEIDVHLDALTIFNNYVVMTNYDNFNKVYQIVLSYKVS
ncbi:transmembrane protein, putative [Medicago truncatula]|uniref:Transmembrane protein, putative n=1 Tax=Medicago truncatula TaxID=3880 RepID=A0A072TXT7_MEDTR|nr:transmembrane protein, putative [Medicago truncatula]